MEGEGVQERPINAGKSRRNAGGPVLSVREWTGEQAEMQGGGVNEAWKRRIKEE